MNNTVIAGEINISSLLKARQTFKQALQEANSPLTLDGTIQRFGYSFELAWKTLKRILKFNGITVNSPRDSIRMAAKEHFIDNPEAWFKFLEYRNNTLHTYNMDVAEEMFKHLPSFDEHLDILIKIICEI